jgi:hypothetical protein
MSPAHAPDRLPAWAFEDSAWRAALHVLTSDRFASDRRVWAHLDLEQAWIDWPAIVAEGWSPATTALLVATAQLWADAATVDQLPPLDLEDLVARLDNGNWRLLLAALAIRRAGLRGSAWPLDVARLLEEA